MKSKKESKILLFIVIGCGVACLLIFLPKSIQVSKTQNQFGNPFADLRKSVAKGDFRFQAIRGLSVSTPGTSITSQIVKANGFKIIEDTHDYTHSESDASFQEAAAQYAFAYNSELLKIITHRKSEAKVGNVTSLP